MRNREPHTRVKNIHNRNPYCTQHLKNGYITRVYTVKYVFHPCIYTIPLSFPNKRIIKKETKYIHDTQSTQQPSID